MFALITLTCVATGWTAYQLDWIRQRREFFNKSPRYETSETKVISYTVCRPVYTVRAPGLLWMFGEDGRKLLMLPLDEYSDEDARRAEALFPEAHVARVYVRKWKALTDTRLQRDTR